MNCTVEAILGISEQELTRLGSRERKAFLSEDGQTFVHKTTGKQTNFGKFEVLKLHKNPVIIKFNCFYVGKNFSINFC